MLLLGFVSCSDDEEKMSDFGLPVGKTVGVPMGELGRSQWKCGVVMSTTEAGDLAFFLCTPDVQGGGYVAVLSHDVSRSGYIVYGLDKDCNVCYVSNITWSNTEGGGYVPKEYMVQQVGDKLWLTTSENDQLVHRSYPAVRALQAETRAVGCACRRSLGSGRLQQPDRCLAGSRSRFHVGQVAGSGPFP